MGVEAMGTQIRIPQGDTGVVRFVCDKGEISGEEKALFTIVSRNGGTILRKVLTLDENEQAFYLPFTYEETAGMKPDSYDWSLRVVSGSTLDTSGKITSTKASHTAVLCGKLMILPVAGGAK